MATIASNFEQQTSSFDDAPLIGGIAGGVVALLLLVSVILLFIWRCREPQSIDVAQSVDVPLEMHRTSEYGVLPAASTNSVQYDDVTDVLAPQYDSAESALRR